MQPPEGFRPLSQLTRLRGACFVCIALGTVIMCLLLLQPVWNAILILNNPVFQYFVGERLPSVTIAACVCLVIVYVLTIIVFFRYSRKASQSEQNILMITNMFATTLGAMVLIISMPIRGSGIAAAGEIWDKCQHGPKTHDLYHTYNQLVRMRRTPECAVANSTEFCNGFKQTRYTDLLKAMEDKYQCSGWCSPPTLTRAPDRVPIEFSLQEGTALVQLDVKHDSHHDKPIHRTWHPWALHDPGLQQLSQHAAARSQAGLGPGSGMGLAPMEGFALPRYVYPPALFSHSVYEASCDGMAAQDARTFLVDTADALYYEGLYLMVISVGIGFLKLLGFCIKDNIFQSMKRSGYGATPNEDIAKFLSEGSLRNTPHGSS